MARSKVIDYISKLEHPDNYSKSLKRIEYVRIPVYLKEGTVPAGICGDTRKMQYAELKECPICLHRYRPTKIVERFEGIHEIKFNCINCNVITIIEFIDPKKVVTGIDPDGSMVEWNPVGVVTDWKINSTKVPEYENFHESATRNKYFPKLGKLGKAYEIDVNYKVLNDDFIRDPFGTTKKLSDDQAVDEYSISVGPNKKIELNDVKLRDCSLPMSEWGKVKYKGPLNLDAFDSFEDKTAAFFEIARSNLMSKDELITMAKQWGLVKDKHQIRSEKDKELMKYVMQRHAKENEQAIADGMKMFYVHDFPNWMNDYFKLAGAYSKDLNTGACYQIPNRDKCTFELSKAAVGTDSKQKTKDDIFDAMTLGFEPLQVLTLVNEYQKRLNEHMNNMLDMVIRGKTEQKLDLIIVNYKTPLNNSQRIHIITKLLRPYVSSQYIPYQHLNEAYKQIKPYVNRYIMKYTKPTSLLRKKDGRRLITDAFLMYLYQRFVLKEDILKE